MNAANQELNQNYQHRVGDQAIFMVTRIHHLMTRKANQILNCQNFPLQIDQLPVLFVVLLAGNQLLSQQEIADLLNRDKSGIQRSIRTLERDGYLRILADTGDRRRNMIRLTPAGKITIEQVLQITATVDETIMSALTADERRAFVDAARKIITQLNA